MSTPTSKSLLRALPSLHPQPIRQSHQQLSQFLPFTQTRHESTTRRHRKLLFLPESPSYTPSSSSPSLIYNPPSSAPSVFHTPLKFLPNSDRRKDMYATHLASSTLSAQRNKTGSIAVPGTPLTSSSALPPSPSAKLPAALRTTYQKTYSVTPSQMEEMRQLRKEDPDKWTRVKLAERFGCSQFFVGMVAKNEIKAKKVEKEHARRREWWGKRRRGAREERGRRREGWGRDD